jgi:hypothetical protein
LNTLPRTVNSRHSFTRRVAPSSLYPGLPKWPPQRGWIYAGLS